MDIPAPHRIGSMSTRWCGDDLLRVERERGINLSADIAGRMLTVKQVAARYGASVATVWRWARETAARQDRAAG